MWVWVCAHVCVCAFWSVPADFAHCNLSFTMTELQNSIQPELFTAVNIGTKTTITAVNCIWPHVTENKVSGRAVVMPALPIITWLCLKGCLCCCPLDLISLYYLLPFHS